MDSRPLLIVDSVDIELLGRARKVIITKDSTTIVEGSGSAADVKGRIAQIKREIDDTCVVIVGRAAGDGHRRHQHRRDSESLEREHFGSPVSWRPPCASREGRRVRPAGRGARPRARRIPTFFARNSM